MIKAIIRLDISGDLVDSCFAECSFLVRNLGVIGGLPQPATPLDSVTEIALNALYPATLAQINSELPNSSLQVSDVALGISWDRAIGIATGNAGVVHRQSHS